MASHGVGGMLLDRILEHLHVVPRLSSPQATTAVTILEALVVYQPLSHPVHRCQVHVCSHGDLFGAESCAEESCNLWAFPLHRENKQSCINGINWLDPGLQILLSVDFSKMHRNLRT